MKEDGKVLDFRCGYDILILPPSLGLIKGAETRTVEYTKTMKTTCATVTH